MGSERIVMSNIVLSFTLYYVIFDLVKLFVSQLKEWKICC